MDICQIENYKFRAEKMEDQNLAVGLLTSHYIPVNIWLIRYLGLDAALFLSAVFEELFYLKEIGKATYYGSDVKFSVRKAQMRTGLGETRQRKAIKVLESHNLLKAYNTGWVPKYRNISFNFSGFRAFENELNNFINKETTKSKKSKEEFEKKMKVIHDDYVNKKEKWAEEHILAEHKKFAEWVAAHPGEDFYEAHRIQTDACYLEPPIVPAGKFNGFTF